MNAPRRAPRRRVDGVFLLDKPLGISSNHALQVVRRLFNAEKAGHTGTLDPLATGLLPICLGEATKFSSDLLEADKSYRAEIVLGTETTTCDAEGDVTVRHEVNVGLADVERALRCFDGPVRQVPPMYSALKRDGKPLYEYARSGIELEIAAREVTIHGITLLDFSADKILFDVHCSKGTYIRTLSQDIGRKLGCGAHLVALRRVSSAHLTLDMALTLDQLEALELERRDALLLPVDSLSSSAPTLYLTEAESNRICHGQSIIRSSSTPGRARLYCADGQFLGLGMADTEGKIAPLRLLAHRSPPVD